MFRALNAPHRLVSHSRFLSVIPGLIGNPCFCLSSLFVIFQIHTDDELLPMSCRCARLAEALARLGFIRRMSPATRGALLFVGAHGGAPDRGRKGDLAFHSRLSILNSLRCYQQRRHCEEPKGRRPKRRSNLISASLLSFV